MAPSARLTSPSSPPSPVSRISPTRDVIEQAPVAETLVAQGAPDRGAGLATAGATEEARMATADSGALHPAPGSHPRPPAAEPAPPSAVASPALWIRSGPRRRRGA